MNSLTPATLTVIEKLFAPADRAEAAALLLEEYGRNLSPHDHRDQRGMERVMFAMLRASEGNLDRLYQMVELAQSDWRDVLMVARFGDSVTAHEEWYAALSGKG